MSDLVFGLALSIGALTFLSAPPSSSLDVVYDIAGFGFSFLVLISVWLRYTDVMSVLPIETGATLLLNVVLLFLVSLEPYLFNVVTLYAHGIGPEVADYASLILSADFAGMMVILAFFTHELALEERGLIPAELIIRYKRIRNFLFLWAALFALTILPPFWSLTIADTPLRFFMWLIPLIFSWAQRITQKIA